MSSNSETFNPFDPTGMLKDMRDASMDAWAKVMVDVVNTDAYADASGAMLDAWLVSSGPFRKAVEDTMKNTLASLNLPSRDEVTRLAERLTNIEVRLDDMDAKLDEVLSACRSSMDNSGN
ncbi:hypothetical protein NG895_04990 [Aeoliella sp. ICT_H6.2]|uniref:Poly(3-hydroxyalkanoate) polymerase subunit PhaE n=1 Tax=Aeoliella straminimaris TaxID=2954799 RepID=A0A9X2F7H3_9BACT|nr:hypothetical protein [Aeoliella straminimaris]MCO6043254.1 hypothetical protein [Aeoliella straminimaris]